MIKKTAIFFLDEEGQATVEYILILSVTVVGALQFGRALIATLTSGLLTLGGQLERDLKSGRLQLTTWSN